MSQWYYQLFGEEFGPVSGESLRELLKEGTLSSSDKVRSVSSAEWIAAERVAADLQSPSDLASDLSELSFEFEESGPTSRRNAYQPNDSDAPTAKPQTRDPDADDAVEDDRLLYFLQVGEESIGPVTIDILIRRAESGKLLASNMVRSEDDDEWQPASEVHELSVAFLLRDMHGEAPVSEPSAGSSTASKPAGTAAGATVRDQNATVGKSKAAADAPASTGKKKKKGGGKTDDALVNDILSEVFSEEEPAPVSKKPGLYSDGSSETASSGSPVGTPRPVTAPVRQEPTAVSSMSATSQAAAAAARAYAPASQSKGNQRGGSRIRLEFGTPAKAVLGILVAVALWFAYAPVMKMFKPETDRYVRRMELAVQTLDALNPATQAVTYKGQMSSIGREFGAYATAMNEAGSSSASAQNCLGALSKLVELSKTDMKDLEKHKQLLTETKALLKAYREK